MTALMVEKARLRIRGLCPDAMPVTIEHTDALNASPDNQ